MDTIEVYVVAFDGRKAGVIVNKTDDKCATAHDLRRAFGTRWATKVKPAARRQLMRHESIDTTMRFYVDIDADDLADELRALHDQGRTLGPFPPAAPQRIRRSSRKPLPENRLRKPPARGNYGRP
ncbi:MAG: site-specific integrase [Pirellulales bacterium]|nr:site-specific integrase [Pirellulales bacterium]